jgi:hypothetical protein
LRVSGGVHGVGAETVVAIDRAKLIAPATDTAGEVAIA